MITLFLTAWFTVQAVDWDVDTYNVLLESDSGDLVATWYKRNPPILGSRSYKNLKVECQLDALEILEGNGKRGSPWIPEDDWYVNRHTKLCTTK